MICVNLKLFAMARDLAGIGETTLSLEEGAVASTALDYLVHQNPKFSQWKDHVRIAVNSEYVDFNYRLHDGDEVAIIPPVSGG